MSNHLRRTFRGLALRAFSALQVGLAWLCLPLSLALTRKQRQATGRRQILVISLGAIGDHILIVPTLQALRTKYPDHVVTLIVRPLALGLQRLLPECVDRELAFPYQNRPLARFLQPLQAMRFVAANDLKAGTELAIIPRWEWDSWGAYFLAFFSRAPRRVSFSENVSYEKQVHNWLSDSLCTDLYHAPAAEREGAKLRLLMAAHEQLQAGELSGALRPRTLAPAQTEDVVHLVLAPIAGHARRNWPLENWARLMEDLRNSGEPVRFSILGSAADRVEVTPLATGKPDVTLLCGLPFADLVGHIGGADLFLGADSGMAHLAGAAGLPVIQIFCHPKGAAAEHYNSPTRFTASSPHTTVLQPWANPGCEQACEAAVPCCIKNVSLKDVLQAVRSQLPVHQRA